MGKVGKQYASYTGVMARTIIPIHISSWLAVDDHLKEKIWTKITEIHELQKESCSKCKYHHRTSRKGYIGVVEELVDKKIVAKDEEVDRALLWKVAREDKNGKILDEEVVELAGTIEKLLKEKEEGLITVSGYNDVLAMALGTPEHGGRVRGVGGYVKPNAFFNVPRKKRECVSKEMVKERDVLLQETKKIMEEQQKKHEAMQELLQKQIEMLKVAISGQTCNVSNSSRIPNISHMFEKASTNIP
ncbi:uncharacterized protein LOC18791159 [Prunus persica]|uniref:uncharacterized protein LOC18791159 n=1 Tax=Prunus persica TaxID=3760 RepID=UPI0009AB66CC|nr:uncharacterized protein LOC18791159 [Prunus persica]XP_020417782.1 uncharacterized protein LOC18791159 [Prunus persica]XP_020417787.1 uncharacterized protein LOC18791159 [Prunus persica]XP_020417794.1 uncharacterized protein LOC18791159 [Prunus persica]XP_020417800.1 uncharacterized protein LOC18791159 [Prunus persica]